MMPDFYRRIGTALFITAALFCWGGMVSAKDDKPAIHAAPSLTDSELTPLITDLGAADWRTRESATQVLMNHGPELYEPLKQAYQQTSQYEVRHRVKQIVREIFLSKRLGPSPAFLGIQHTGRPVGLMADPRVPAGSTAILITQVIASTAAQRVGLQRGDLILALNGGRAMGKSTAMKFTQWIGAQAPGTHCRLGIVRGGQAFILNKKDTRSFDPRIFAKLKTRVLVSKDDHRILPKMAGLLLAEDQDAGRRLGLKKGDLLIAFDGQPIPVENAPASLKKWVESLRIQTQHKERSGGLKRIKQLQKRGSRLPIPSVQVLRGGQWLELTAVLGRRPAFLLDVRAGPRGTGSAKLSDADAAFEVWWQDEFSLPRRPADRFDADPAWQLQP